MNRLTPWSTTVTQWGKPLLFGTASSHACTARALTCLVDVVSKCMHLCYVSNRLAAALLYGVVRVQDYTTAQFAAVTEPDLFVTEPQYVSNDWQLRLAFDESYGQRTRRPNSGRGGHARCHHARILTGLLERISGTWIRWFPNGVDRILKNTQSSTL